MSRVRNPSGAPFSAGVVELEYTVALGATDLSQGHTGSSPVTGKPKNSSRLVQNLNKTSNNATLLLHDFDLLLLLFSGWGWGLVSKHFPFNAF